MGNKKNMPSEIEMQAAVDAISLDMSTDAKRNKVLKDTTCITCKARLSTISSLKRHIILVHTKLEPVPCQFCKTILANKYSLALHLSRKICVKSSKKK
ncbi:unnamed protein product [Allacma fusca]|uniref:C2H2-type domain-containing protein n=1 Tax=Allacma fusca TaxID=39272 RepID=A0A8J2JIL8_9HEXA|nr:unnamed protein product [Allacma fusca]